MPDPAPSTPAHSTPAPIGTEGATGTPLPPRPSGPETVTVILDGREVTAEKGELIITVADRAGVYIPRFCYHPRMKAVGMCRMCLVEVEGPRGSTLMPACFNPVSDGQKISTESSKAKKAQDGVLEFLLINHPLDCPVCDKGGECPLQDQTLAYGPGETRFVEEKRHWDKPIPISELVYLDRERCIQCARCVRFADEVAGDALIDFAERGDMTEVATFPEAPYASYFSGNVVQICPVGALTAEPYRFKARPWDLEQVESSCTSCSVGCRVAVQSSSDQLTRYIGVDSDPVNWGWLCDKGRFDFQAVNSPARLSVPLVRQGDELVEVGWTEALATIAARLDGLPGSQVAVIGGARLANEDAYAWSKLARTVLGTDHVDAQLGDGIPADVLLGLRRATIDQAASAAMVVTIGIDVKEELPVLYLRLRHAFVNDGTPIVELSPTPTGMTRYAARSHCYRPGDLAAVVRAVTGSAPVTRDVGGLMASDLEVTRSRVAEVASQGDQHNGQPSIVVVLGRGSLADSDAGLVEATRALAGVPGVAFLSGVRRANVHGALDMGLAPGVLPGRVGLDEGREWYEQQWGTELPASHGFGTGGILAAAAHGTIGALFLLGADPLADFPDATAAASALDGARFVVAVDTYLTESARHADVILPAAGYAERRGTTTNLEGRISWLGQMVTAPGVAWPDWTIAVALADRLGADLGFSSLEEIWSEVEKVSPLHRGATYDVIASRGGRDGILVPVSDHPRSTGTTLRPLDPMADPGIASAETHNSPPTTLSVGGAGANRTDPSTEPAPGAAADGSPAMLAGAGGESGSAPPADDTVPGMRLVAQRQLWDAGTQVAHSPSLAGLYRDPVARVHPDELARLGLEGATTVRIANDRGQLDIALAGDATVPAGVVVVPWHMPGARASVLIDASAPITHVDLHAVEGGGD